MHQGNRDWLKQTREKYIEHFKDANVLEIGSYDVNGTARDYFKDAKRYVGVDSCKGKCVDIVANATETVFSPGEFDTLVYLSVFEHDPIWRAGFEHNLQWVRTGGLILICFGAEGNLPHPPDPWAIVPAKAFHDAAKEMPIEILDAFFEMDRQKQGITYDTPGAYDVLARKIDTVEPVVSKPPMAKIIIFAPRKPRTEVRGGSGAPLTMPYWDDPNPAPGNADPILYGKPRYEPCCESLKLLLDPTMGVRIGPGWCAGGPSLQGDPGKCGVELKFCPFCGAKVVQEYVEEPPKL